MAKNRAGTGKRITATAAADRSSGVPIIEQGWFGFPETNAESGDMYALNVDLVEWEVDVTGLTIDVGDFLYMSAANAFTTTNTDTLVMKVSEILSATKARAITLPQNTP